MRVIGSYPSRRRVAAWIGMGAAAAGMPGVAKAAAPELFMDGHVHVTNRIYWEKIDAWQPHEGGWDYARAWKGGVNCIIENIGTHGYWNYNYTPKQALRLIETFHEFAERHADKMAVALTPADARKIVRSGRMAAFLGCEAGWDQEGDPDVLAAFHRLGLRVVQFTSQSAFNAFGDTSAAFLNDQAPNHFGGINERGRALVDQMNRLGILIDITHGTAAAQRQLIEASRAPVVASHETVLAVSGAGLPDDIIKALAAKGGLVGLHGAASVVGKRYRKWMAEHPEEAAQSGAATLAMLKHQASTQREPGDHGEFIAQFDAETAQLLHAMGEAKENPGAAPFIPTADEWAEHAAYLIELVGADHIAIGLDMAGTRASVPQDPSGYPDLRASLKKITSPANVRKITGENWLRVLGDAKRA